MTTELIISTSSVVIALAALFVACWQGHLARKHNRLSVFPSLQTHTDQSDSGLTGCIELTLANSGVGPAIVKTIQLKKNGNDVGELSNELIDAELRGLPLTTKNVRTLWMEAGYFMSEKETLSLVLIEFETTDPRIKVEALLAEIQRIFDSYEIVIGYESIYGDTFELDTTKIRSGESQRPQVEGNKSS